MPLGRAIGSTGRKTPYELLFSKRPDLNRLRVYGSPVYAGVPPETLRKHVTGTLRAEQGRFMGQGPARSRFLPEVSHKCVHQKPVHVVETGASIHAGLWAQLAVDAAARHTCLWPSPEHVPRTPP
jgi:hypothetical protein